MLNSQEQEILKRYREYGTLTQAQAMEYHELMNKEIEPELKEEKPEVVEIVEKVFAVGKPKKKRR